VIVLVTPHFPLLTKRARKVLPLKVPMAHFIQNMAFSCALVAAVAKKNAHAFGEAIQDVVVEPKRSALIPGFSEVKIAALKNGAFGCSISGAGSTLFAITDHAKKGEKIGRAMQRAFQRKGLKATVMVSRMDRHGVRMVKGKVH